jgi:hypothetical protein
MNADPFRPLPTRRDYEADMAQLDEPEQRKPRFPWEWIAYAAALCVAVAWVVMEVVE